MSEEHASDAQIKRLYAVLHSLKIDPKQWKKEQGFGNYSKLSGPECSEYIDNLEEIEIECKKQFNADKWDVPEKHLPTQPNGTQRQIDTPPSDHIKNSTQQQEAAPHGLAEEMLHLQQIMAFAMQSANYIVDHEISNCGADSTAAQIKQKTAVSIFIEATKRGL